MSRLNFPDSAPLRCGLLIGLLGFFLSSGLLWGANEAPRSANTVIFPQPTEATTVRPTGTPSTAYFVFVLVCLGVGAWLWFRAKGKGRGLSSVAKEISIEETRPLGNRQYLVLASCRGRSFLVGVSQGRIDVISEVPPSETAP